MTATNDITGDPIKTKVTTESYRENYDKIFSKTKKYDDRTVSATDDSLSHEENCGSNYDDY